MGTRAQDALAPQAVRIIEPLRIERAAQNLDLLRVCTAGGVDDGKSTLIGQLLIQTGSVPVDQLRAADAASHRRGQARNLAYLTDGLQQERDQSITIDVAYRHFATSRRRFILADVPGHVQYMRNMLSGASQSELLLLLLDATHPLSAQARQHAVIASILGIRNLVVAVNKMDLVAYAEPAFRGAAEEFSKFSAALNVDPPVFIPVSALGGENVAARSSAVSWYRGPSLLECLENAPAECVPETTGLLFPVQYVIRSSGGYRGLAGRVISGQVRTGDDVIILPSGRRARVALLEQGGQRLERAKAGDAAVLLLGDHVDVGRGDIIARASCPPPTGTQLEVDLCCISGQPLATTATYVVRHTTRTVRARIKRVLDTLDVVSGLRTAPTEPALTGAGRVELEIAEPLAFERYQKSRKMGALLLLDEFSRTTLAAGMIRNGTATPARGAGLDQVGSAMSREERNCAYGHGAAVVWLTGLSASGKSTLARELACRLDRLQCRTAVLDGDQFRRGLCSDLGFSPADRSENIRRAGEVARLLFLQGKIVICAFISPIRQDRDRVRHMIGRGSFFEVFVQCDIEECRRRDPKGLYAAAAGGKLGNLTGVDQTYEPPLGAALIARSQLCGPDELAEKIVNLLRQCGILRWGPGGEAHHLDARPGDE